MMVGASGGPAWRAHGLGRSDGAPRAIELVVFDFDGLILDTESPEFECWREVYAAEGGELTLATWAMCIGTAGAFDPWTHLEAQVGRPVDRAGLDAGRCRRFDELLAGEATRPGVADYLAGARRLRIGRGLASSSSRAWVTGHLARLGLLNEFDVLRCADDVERVKPEPDLYRAVLAARDVPPSRAVAFEDSPNGILAAKRAGLFCVAVPNAVTRGLSLDGADVRLGSLAEMPLEEVLGLAARAREGG